MEFADIGVSTSPPETRIVAETQISARFDVITWEESALDDSHDLPKIAWATWTSVYWGEMQGESTTQWLVAYAEDGSTHYVGLERFRGAAAGRDGSMVIQHVGTYADSTVKGSLTVVVGSGTDGLASASGEGTFFAHRGGSVRLSLQF